MGVQYFGISEGKVGLNVHGTRGIGYGYFSGITYFQFWCSQIPSCINLVNVQEK